MEEKFGGGIGHFPLDDPNTDPRTAIYSKTLVPAPKNTHRASTRRSPKKTIVHDHVTERKRKRTQISTTSGEVSGGSSGEAVAVEGAEVVAAGGAELGGVVVLAGSGFSPSRMAERCDEIQALALSFS